MFLLPYILCVQLYLPIAPSVVLVLAAWQEEVVGPLGFLAQEKGSAHMTVAPAGPCPVVGERHVEQAPG